jgi:dihydrofolate synthase/folylpolyglutamate synthase
MDSLDEFLKSKGLSYKDIDYGFMPKLWQDIEHLFKSPKIIHVVGTNGKGSTGRFLAHYLFKSGVSVGHFTSPHIRDFNERFWINNRYVDDLELEEAHCYLQNILDLSVLDKISYFEYATLLSITLFQKCDFFIVEAGLGGEFDATNVFTKEFSLITPISKDHQDFLGDSLDQITRTKLNSVTTFAILAPQNKDVYKVIDNMNISTLDSYDLLDQDELLEIDRFIIDNYFASYLKDNLTLAMGAIKKLGIEYDLDNLKGIELFGRCSKIASNITIDVGHNPLAATVLKNEFRDKEIVLIYNTYKDKDFKEILTILRPIIKLIMIVDIDNDRVVEQSALKQVVKELNIPFCIFNKSLLKSSEEHLVFGSFVIVEQFLRNYST